jgi:hypothetical protein
MVECNIVYISMNWGMEILLMSLRMTKQTSLTCFGAWETKSEPTLLSLFFATLISKMGRWNCGFMLWKSYCYWLEAIDETFWEFLRCFKQKTKMVKKSEKWDDFCVDFWSPSSLLCCSCAAAIPLVFIG